MRLQVQNGQSSAHRKGGTLCNSQTKGQQAIRELARAMSDRTGNMPPLAGIFPDYLAPIVRNQPDGREFDHVTRSASCMIIACAAPPRVQGRVSEAGGAPRTERFRR